MNGVAGVLVVNVNPVPITKLYTSHSNESVLLPDAFVLVASTVLNIGALDAVVPFLLAPVRVKGTFPAGIGPTTEERLQSSSVGVKSG